MTESAMRRHVRRALEAAFPDRATAWIALIRSISDGPVHWAGGARMRSLRRRLGGLSAVGLAPRACDFCDRRRREILITLWNDGRAGRDVHALNGLRPSARICVRCVALRAHWAKSAQSDEIVAGLRAVVARALAAVEATGATLAEFEAFLRRSVASERVVGTCDACRSAAAIVRRGRARIVCDACFHDAALVPRGPDEVLERLRAGGGPRLFDSKRQLPA